MAGKLARAIVPSVAALMLAFGGSGCAAAPRVNVQPTVVSAPTVEVTPTLASWEVFTFRVGSAYSVLFAGSGTPIPPENLGFDGYEGSCRAYTVNVDSPSGGSDSPPAYRGAGYYCGDGEPPGVVTYVGDADGCPIFASAQSLD